MTNKEAYEILEKSIRCNSDDCPPVDCDECPYSVTTEQFDNAFQMAMNALQEPKPPQTGSTSCTDAQNPHVRTTDDLISRQAAIDTING